MKSFSWDELHLAISGNSQNLLFITTLSLVYFKFQKKCTKIYYSTRRVKQNLQQEFVYPPPWCAVVKLPHDFWLCGTVATLNRSIGWVLDFCELNDKNYKFFALGPTGLPAEYPFGSAFGKSCTTGVPILILLVNYCFWIWSNLQK
jgi:hypothetical protein